MLKPLVAAIVSMFLLMPCAAQDALAPGFRLQELGSEQWITLQEYRGKVVYLDFWASWCGPCRQSLPALNELHRQLDNGQFEVVAINLDADHQDALGFLEEYPVDYTVLVDRSGETPRAYELTGLPTSVLIDQNGVLVASFEGFDPGHLEQLRRAIAILLQE